MIEVKKKPIIVEAIQLTYESWEEVHELLKNSSSNVHSLSGTGNSKTGYGLVIHTLEGDMTAYEGDWIIRGVKGELYPIKKDIFEETYEIIEE